MLSVCCPYTVRRVVVAAQSILTRILIKGAGVDAPPLPPRLKPILPRKFSLTKFVQP